MGAQHAITTTSGSRSLFSLKAARDALNIDREHGLRIVATGSNRDKLSMLRASKDQAFFGAPLTAFPPLGREYVEWFVTGRGLEGELDVDEVTRWFERSGNRPELLPAAADALLHEIGADHTTLAKRLERVVTAEVRAADDVLMRGVHSLTELQLAVLREMTSSGIRYAPFERRTMARYAMTLDETAPAPNDANVQSALVLLQRRGPVWRASRGVYALEDSRLAESMRSEGMVDWNGPTFHLT